MFALIDTKNATHIAIHIPAKGADKSLPALINMLEHNAVFIRRTYHSFEEVVAETSITLGNKLRIDSYDAELVIQEAGLEFEESFEPLTPELVVNHSKMVKRNDETIKIKNDEITVLKAQWSAATSRLNQVEVDLQVVIEDNNELRAKVEELTVKCIKLQDQASDLEI